MHNQILCGVRVRRRENERRMFVCMCVCVCDVCVCVRVCVSECAYQQERSLCRVPFVFASYLSHPALRAK